MQLAVAAAGAAVGSSIASSVMLPLWASSALPGLGWMVGSALGASLVKPKTQYNIQSPATDLRVTGTEYGQMIPVLIGHDRIAGQLWWASDFIPISHTTVSGGGGGKGGGGQPQQVNVNYTYDCNFILGLTDHEIAGVSRIWIDGALVYNLLDGASETTIAASVNSERWTRMTVYTGTSTQLPDPVYEAAVGSDLADGLRHRSYLFFEGFHCGDTPRLPNITVEVVVNGLTSTVGGTVVACAAGVSSNQFAYSADDGQTWSAVTAPGAATNWQVVKYGNGIYLALNSSNRSCYSLDGGATWQEGGALPASLTWSRLAFDVKHERWVAMASNSTNTKTATSDDNGLTWTERAFPATVGTQNADLVYNGQLELLLTDVQGNFYYSGDGAQNWTPVGQGAGSFGGASMQVGSVERTCFVHDASVTPFAKYTDDGLTYQTASTVGAAGGWNNLCAGNGKFVATTSPASTAVAASADGDTWTIGAMPNNRVWCVAPTSTGFAAVNLTGTESAVSVDGVNWTASGAAPGVGMSSIASRPAVVATTIGYDEVTLRDAVEFLCERAGLESTEYDASALDAITKPVRGLPIGRVGPTRPILEQLMAFYFFDLRVSDKIYFVPRAGAAVATLAYNDLGAHLDSEEAPEPFTLEMASGIELPSKLVLSYRDVAADYTVATVESDPLLTVLNDSVGEVSTDMAMTASEAKAALNVMARDQFIAQTGTQIALTGRYDKLEAADPVAVTDSSGNVFRMRVVEATDAYPLIQLKLAHEDPAIYQSQGITGAVSGGSSVVNPVADTVLEALDIPLLRDVDDEPGYYGAAKGSTTPWPGAAGYTSPDDVEYTQKALFNNSAVIGFCTTTLPDWNGARLFDETSRVTVNVGSGELSSSTRAALIASKSVNLCAIGEHGRWELLQFRTATLVSPGVYMLSGLLRGMFGTEWAMVGHEGSDDFVLLTSEGVRRLGLNNAELGVAHYVKGVTLGRLLSTATGTAFTCNGVNLKPWAPVDFRVARDTSDNCTLTWRRRTRKNARMFGTLGTSVPLGEASEAYEVEIYDDDTYTTRVRTISTSSETASYSAAEQTADGLTPGDPIYAMVFQRSEVIGRGYALTAQG